MSSQLPPPRSISSTRPAADAGVGHDPEVNETAFFHAADDLDTPAGGGMHPVDESGGIVGVTQGAGGDDAHPGGAVGLGCLVEAPQHTHGLLHGRRVKGSGAEDALAQAHDLAILMQHLKTLAHDTRNL